MQVHSRQELWIRRVCFVAPKFIGGNEAPGVFDGEGIKRLADAPELERLTITQLDCDLLIEGYCIK